MCNTIESEKPKAGKPLNDERQTGWNKNTWPHVMYNQPMTFHWSDRKSIDRKRSWQLFDRTSYPHR